MMNKSMKLIARKDAPPARLLAGVRGLLKAQGLPDDFAQVMATYSPSVEVAEALIEAAKVCSERTKGEEAVKAFSMAMQGLEAGEFETAPLADRAKHLAAAAIDTLTPQRPKVLRDWSAPEAIQEKMADAMLALIDKTHAPTVGREYSAKRLSEFAVMSEENAGRRHRTRDDAIRAAMAANGVGDFPVTLGRAMDRYIARRMELRAPDILRAASKRVLEDYRPSRVLTLPGLNPVREVLENGEIEHMTFEEKGEFNPVLRDFAGGFNITNKVVADDDLGLVEGLMRSMVEACIAKQRQVLLEPLLANAGNGQTMANGLPMFSAENGNIPPDVGDQITVASLSAARTSMRKQKDRAGQILALEPWGLVVPPERETEAQQVLAELHAARVQDVNPFTNTLELIVEPGLENPMPWYLIANPSFHEGLVWATLEGLDGPRVESRVGWETLGMQFRVIWALDAKFTEHATWYRNPGQGG
ncbi:MAG: hypothetical protein EA339_13425 [Rhodobacteraceae bacterium]|nr:MAG: hypothetical protein EA339_13425 [Paracoccaceae bacterium]